ncbi:hypothetical protein [Streptomyces ipomoeae]|uniref:hypothetical protein n=1 Tax=Streptomyces ipomoeae TaxID=103232 RepID=UPI00299FDBB3|nr:hypothetical protein [Streptomyces ipomoeae]MDX2692196.1 hypothetical protein [Streptomyces ipomoeae]MDX2839303.1 hypothetical protein [Streptomyces ipomoeae]
MARTRGTGPSKGVWAAGIAAAAVLALTGYAMFGGGDDSSSEGKGGASASPSASGSASPSATYQAPQDWTEPERWVALPRGERTDANGNEVGFPHTTEGAVAMLSASGTTNAEGNRTLVDEQLGVYESYVLPSEKSAEVAERVELNGLQADKNLRRRMGLRPGSDLPSGAYARSYTVGYKIIKESPDEVSAWFLSRVVQKNGETAKESSSYTRTLLGAEWNNGDWKISGAATSRALQLTKGKARPDMVAPGDEAFNSAGWTAIREAS